MSAIAIVKLLGFGAFVVGFLLRAAGERSDGMREIGTTVVLFAVLLWGCALMA